MKMRGFFDVNVYHSPLEVVHSAVVPHLMAPYPLQVLYLKSSISVAFLKRFCGLLHCFRSLFSWRRKFPHRGADCLLARTLLSSGLDSRVSP